MRSNKVTKFTFGYQCLKVIAPWAFRKKVINPVLEVVKGLHKEATEAYLLVDRAVDYKVYSLVSWVINGVVVDRVEGRSTMALALDEEVGHE